MNAFREAASESLAPGNAPSVDRIEEENTRLRTRLRRFGDCQDALQIWERSGIGEPQELPLLDNHEFLARVNGLRN